MRLCEELHGVRHGCVRTIDVEWIVFSSLCQTSTIVRTQKLGFLTTNALVWYLVLEIYHKRLLMVLQNVEVPLPSSSRLPQTHRNGTCQIFSPTKNASIKRLATE